MKNETEQIKKSILVPLGIAFVALLAITVGGVQWWTWSQSVRETEDAVRGAQRVYEAVLAKDAEVMLGLLDCIEEDEGLRKAWLGRDRETLLRRAQPRFDEFKRKYRVTHFYFHGPDHLNFLRVHQPSRHGDLIDRYTLEDAARRQQASWGVELGPLGTFTLRVVVPWYIDGTLAGYLELGEEISHVVRQLKETLGIEMLSVIDKRFVQRAQWEEGMVMLRHPPDWNLFERHVISEQTLRRIPHGLKKELGVHHAGQATFSSFSTTLDRIVYDGGIVPLKEISGREVGNLIILRDCSAKKALLRRLSLIQALSFAVLGLGLYLLFWGYLGRLETLLVTRRRLLEEEVRERQQSEAALRESEERYRDLFENAHDLVLLLRPDGQVLYANRSWREKMGYGSGELGGLSFLDLMAHDCRPDCRQTFKRLLAEGAVANMKLAFLNKEGKRVSVEGSANCKQADGEVVSIRCIFRDVTEQEELKEQLYQSQKIQAIGTLAGGIAHDFNNILTAILGYGELLKKQLAPESEAWGNLQQVLRAGTRARDLVKQILTFSRQASSELRPTQIALLVKEVLRLLRSTIPSRIAITQQIPSSEVVVMADPVQLHQVVMNLCTNSYHAMAEKGGELRVSLTPVELGPDRPAELQGLPPGAYVCLEVGDTGCGMDQATLARIFEPYFTTKERGRGTGLGLSVVHGIVQKHHGHIAVRSEVGKGTTCSIYFPRVETATAAAEEEAPAPMPRGSERILLLDDEESIAHFERVVLERLGYTVRLFTGSEEALAAFRNAPEGFDLIVTDMTMPKMTGIEFAQQVMAIRPEIPIVLCTGFSEVINEQNAKAFGIREFIMKPILERDLAAAVNRVCGRRGS
ncbi:MAG: ATP-binding protein [Thermodesulfobacteriota bacterium]